MAEAVIDSPQTQQQGDIFDQVAPSAPTQAKGDIFDDVAKPTTAPAQPAQPAAQPQGWRDQLTQTHPLNTPRTGNAVVDTGINAVANFGAGVLTPILHPVQTAAGMGQAIEASGMAPGGMYPTTGPGRPQDMAANAQVQQQAQQQQTAAAQWMKEHPGEALPAALGQMTTGVVAGELGGAGWEAFRNARAAELRGTPTPMPEGFNPSAPPDTPAPAPASPEQTAPTPSPAPKPLPPNLQAASDALSGKPLGSPPTAPAVPEAVAPTPTPKPPTPTAADIFDTLQGPESEQGTTIHAGPKPVPEQPPVPQAQNAEQSLLDQIVADHRGKVTSQTPAENQALLNAIDETVRRAHESGDMEEANRAADAHAAVSSLLDEAVRNTQTGKAPNTPQQANLATAADALSGKPLSPEPAQVAPDKGSTPKPFDAKALAAAIIASVPPRPTSKPPQAQPNAPDAPKPVLHASNDVEALRASAERQAPKVGDALAEATKGVPGAKVEAVRDSKDSDRITDKADRQDVDPNQIGDIAAAKVVAPNQQAADQVLQNLHQRFPVESVTGSVGGEPGKNGVQQVQAIVNIAQPGEPVKRAEVLIQTPEMAKATDQTHDDYRKAQELRAAGKEEEAKALEAKIQKVHEAAQQGPYVPKKGDRIQMDGSKPGTVTHVDPKSRKAGVKTDDGRQWLAVPLERLKPEAQTPAKRDLTPEEYKKIKADLTARGVNPADTEAWGTAYAAEKAKVLGQSQSPSNQGEKQEVAQGGTGTGELGQPKIPAKWIGVDLDGTLAKYDGFKGPTVIGEPIAPMVERVKGWLKEGKTVKILTARVSEDPTGEAKKAIEDWTEKHLGTRLEVTDTKDAGMEQLYDDRAVPVERNTGKLLAEPQPEGNNNGTQSGNGGQPNAATTPKGEGSKADAVQKPSAEKLLQRQPGQDADPGGERGRVEPGQQGEGTAGESAHAASEEKPLGGQGGGEGKEEVKDNVSRAAAIIKANPDMDKFNPGGMVDEIAKQLDISRPDANRLYIEAGRKITAEKRKPSETSAQVSDKNAKPETKPAKPETKYKYGNTQADIPPDSPAGKALAALRAKIDPADLMGDGLIEDSHITVRYGIDGDDTSGIRAFLEKQAPFEATLGQTDEFPVSEHSDGAVPIIVPIESIPLRRMEKEIGEHGDFVERSFPQYKPHATIAYVKPEAAHKYVGDPTAMDKTFTVASVSITDRNGDAEEVQLKGKPESSFYNKPTTRETAQQEAKKEGWTVERTGDSGSYRWRSGRPSGRVLHAFAKSESEAWNDVERERMRLKAMEPTPQVPPMAGTSPMGVKATDRDKLTVKGYNSSANSWEPQKFGIFEGLNMVPGEDGFATRREAEDRLADMQHGPLVIKSLQTGKTTTLKTPEQPKKNWQDHLQAQNEKAVAAKEKKAEQEFTEDYDRNPRRYEDAIGHIAAGGRIPSRDELRDAYNEAYRRGYTGMLGDFASDLGEGTLPERYQKPVEKPVEKEERGGVNALIDAIYSKLEDGQSLGNVTELNRMAEKYLGASRTSGEWTPKDLFDAMEAAVNKYLLDIGKGLLQMPAKEALSNLRNLMDRLTTQGTRTEDQIKNQQFSTPPTEAYVVARVAALRPDDIVLEPSAGNGGLAVWPKAIGAEVHVNEIAPRRQAMLEAVGFDKPTAVDGELINALLPQDIHPTVILMNPPFSASTLKSYDAKNQMRYGFNHVDQALQRLAPGGRLVAILGGGREGFQASEGANLRTGEAGKWFDKIAEQYNVRANIRISGKEYQKYGTNYATRIIVIDKDGPTPSKVGPERDWSSVVEKDTDTLEEAYTLLKPVEESRPTNANARPQNAHRPGGSPAASGMVANPNAGVSGVREPAGRSSGTDGEVSTSVRPDRVGSGAAASRPQGGSEQLPIHRPGSKTEQRDESEAPGGAGASPSDGDSKRQVAERGIDLEREQAKVERDEEDDSAYTTYQPTLRGGKHPGSIVETKSMATVPMPEITYKPSLPESVVGSAANDYDNSKLSAVQLEAVAIAGMQNDIILPGGFRGSALIGDGTGVGKGREAAAILWDNWKKGRRRLVWMTKSKDLIVDAVRDLEALGAHDLAKHILNLGKTDSTTELKHEGILFTTYSLFRSGDKKGNTRAAQVEKWLKGDDDADRGYMLMDESHSLKNAVVSQGQQASQIGQTVKKFLERLPKLRTVSLSATAATDVMNLGYLDRLGLWGPGTPFPNGFVQFAGEIAHGGMSAMEMIARELKAQGKYLARTLTFRGVKYSEIEHEITPEQKEVYAAAAKAWRMIFESAEKTITQTTGGGARQKAMAMSQFFSAQQRFFNLLLTSIKIPTAVKTAEEALAAGRSVAITLINTNEAAQNREKDRVAADDSEEEPDYDFGPGKLLTDLVEEHYPVQQYKDDVDSNGNPIKVPVVDDKGNPVINPEALRRRNELLGELKQLKMPANPLDELIEQLGGTSKVAELTGRKQRYDPATNRLVNRGGSGVSQDKVNQAEMAAFQGGKKRIAILSSAADTGISLHADKGAKNQQQRLCITLQVGWSADKALQMMGRFNRSNQVSAPEYALLKTNLGGESRFISSIARRMESLEALSKGQTKTNAGTDAMSKVNFETDQGRAAAVAFYNRLLNNGNIPGALDENGEQLTGRDILRQLRVLKGQSGGGETVPPADRSNITRLLNRLLALSPDVQQPVYNYFYDIFDATVKKAVEDGTLDTGVKKLPGDTFSIQEQRVLSSDPATGASTFYYPVEAQVRVHRMTVKDLESVIKANKDDNPVIMRSPSGKLALVIDAKPIVHADGTTQESVFVFRPDSRYSGKIPRKNLDKYTAVDAAARDRAEKAQDAIDDADRDITYYEKSIERGQANGYSRDYEKNELVNAKTKKATAEAELKDANAALRNTKPIDLVREEWQKQYDEAPTHKSEQRYLIGGAVMRFWNAIRDSAQRLDVYTAVDKDSGERVVGIEIPASQIQRLLARISGGKSTINAEQIVPDVLKNGTQYELEGGVKVRRGRVAGQNVVQLVTPNAGIQEVLKRAGVLYERGVQPIYYLPTGEYGDTSKGERILEQVLKDYPAKVDTGQAPSSPKPSLPDSGTLSAFGFLNPATVNQLFPGMAGGIYQWAGDGPTPGKTQQAIMREERGQMDRRMARALAALEQESNAWDKRPRADFLAFADAVEHVGGKTVADLSVKDQQLAGILEKAYQERKDYIDAMGFGPINDWIDNYFAHWWERPSLARKTIKKFMGVGKRPLEGKASFRKQRKIPTTRDGIDLGLTPATWNPVRGALMKIYEMDQFIMAHQVLKVMKDSGTAKFYRVGADIPEGWTKLDDKIGTVWRRATTIDDQKVEDATYDKTYMGGKRPIPSIAIEDLDDASGKALVITGHYWAPAEAAKVFNNFVSKGLAGRSAIFDALRWANNNLNALQLGISAFHATVTTVNAAASDVALGIEQLFQGKPVKAAGNALAGIALLPSLVRTIKNGWKATREYMKPGTYPEMEKEADWIARSGGRLAPSTLELSPIRKAINAWNSGTNWDKAKSLPSALLQAGVWPVLGFWVPKMKIGAFYLMAHNLLEEAQKKNWTPEKLRERMQEAWDAVDDRFGQIVYENRFWPRGLKDALQLTFRAVGYTNGDVRIYGGAIVDTAKAAGLVATGHGKEARITPKMSFALSSFLCTAILGAAGTFMCTGHLPKDPLHYLYIEDSHGIMHSIAGYPDQIVSFVKHPEQTAINKIAPLWNVIGQAINNQDFYRTEIRHTDDSAPKQAEEFAGWAAKQELPFSATGAAHLLEERGAQDNAWSMIQTAIHNPAPVVESFFGFNQAPAFIQNSDALNKAREYSQTNRPAGTRTKEQTERSRAMHVVEDLIRAGKTDKSVEQAYKTAGVLSEADLTKARFYARRSPLLAAVNPLHVDQAINVYIAATPEEKKEIRPEIERKEREIDTFTNDPEERAKLKKAYQDALNPKPKFNGKPVA